MKILHLDRNHAFLKKQLNDIGFHNEQDYTSSKKEIEQKIHLYDGIVIRSRFAIDQSFIEKAIRLKFIARVGAGLENIDIKCALNKHIKLFSAPEGNRNAVGEHTLGLLLALFNKLHKADKEIRNGMWLREANRGIELDGKTIGIIGYGNMGKAFAKKLKGFDVDVLCYDIKPNVEDANCTQVSLQDIQQKSDVLSIHTPQTKLTSSMINERFINGFQKPFWLLNTARGSAVVTKDLVTALKKGLILGAGLDVLEYEKNSFENLFIANQLPDEFEYLNTAENVILTPHVAGWTIESNIKMAQVIVDKIKMSFLQYD